MRWFILEGCSGISNTSAQASLALVNVAPKSCTLAMRSYREDDELRPQWRRKRGIVNRKATGDFRGRSDLQTSQLTSFT